MMIEDGRTRDDKRSGRDEGPDTRGHSSLVDIGGFR